MVKGVEQKRKINDNGHNAIHACQNMTNGLSSASCFLCHGVSDKTSMRVLSSIATCILDSVCKLEASGVVCDSKVNILELIGG